MKIVIGSRKSDLARIQALAVGAALKALPEVNEIEYLFKTSLGDQNQDDPLWQMPEKGVFTQDLSKDLMAGEVDLVVHSWKDLPVDEREETLIAGTMARADQRDILLFKNTSRAKLPTENSTQIFSSSPRRAHNLAQFLNWALPGGNVQVSFQNVRGNVQTRVRKLMENEEVDGLVVAKAALDRMLGATEAEFKESWEDLRGALEVCSVMVLPLKENPSAAGQGALAMEVLRGRKDLIALIKKINCSETFKNVQEEREILSAHGGGCHQKIGVSRLSRAYGEIHSLKGLTENGESLDLWSLKSEFEPGVSSEQLFPHDMNSARLNGDEDIFYDISKVEMAKALFVAKHRAFPNSWAPDEDQIVWTAGLRTWRKLAEQGVWVNGSSEALGERENPRLENLFGPLKWLRLTHEKAAKSGNDEALATYRLTETPLPSNLGEKNYFYWTSYSSFQRALEAYPELRDRDHSCGPGKTAELIEKALKKKPRIFLSYKEWRSEFK